MEIIKTQNDTALTVAVTGRLDTLTAPKLEAEMETALEGITELILDFERLEYISSAGLRVLLILDDAMRARGTFTIKNAINSNVKEVFEITCFNDVLNIE